MTTVPRLLATLTTVAIIACSSTEVQPVDVAGEYKLTSYNGSSLPAHPAANTVVDTGSAFLHGSGTYEIVVRAFVNNLPQNYIIESGTWTASDRTIQFGGAAVSDNVKVSADGQFTVKVLKGTDQTLGFRRIGDAF